MNNKRAHRISAEIKKIISTSLYNDIKDPRIDAINTGITDVQVTNDLSYATVYISIIGDAEKKKSPWKDLDRHPDSLKKKSQNP